MFSTVTQQQVPKLILTHLHQLQKQKENEGETISITAASVCDISYIAKLLMNPLFYI